jgi:hypothetical protein
MIHAQFPKICSSAEYCSQGFGFPITARFPKIRSCAEYSSQGFGFPITLNCRSCGGIFFPGTWFPNHGSSSRRSAAVRNILPRDPVSQITPQFPRDLQLCGIFFPGIQFSNHGSIFQRSAALRKLINFGEAREIWGNLAQSRETRFRDANSETMLVGMTNYFPSIHRREKRDFAPLSHSFERFESSLDWKCSKLPLTMATLEKAPRFSFPVGKRMSCHHLKGIPH